MVMMIVYCDGDDWKDFCEQTLLCTFSLFAFIVGKFYDDDDDCDKVFVVHFFIVCRQIL